MFDDKSLKTLEYFVILDKLASFAQSNPGKELALSIRPTLSLTEAISLLKYTS